MKFENAIKLRRNLHRHPELSGAESDTAERVARFFEPLRPDGVIRDLGGHGAAFVFAGGKPGLTVLLRAELDALPIHDRSLADHRSTVAGCSHACGHDGHMAILAAVAERLSAERPHRGRAVLLFQPAEEDGRGAAAVINDPKFQEISPDLSFALHNLPGFPLGEIVVRSGPFCCASRGVVVTFEGTSAHAAQPETGTSPAAAMCRFIEWLGELPGRMGLCGETDFATVVGARLGEDDAFGTAPGRARVMATLRSADDSTLDRMAEQTVATVRAIAEEDRLSVKVDWRDEFRATVNSEEAVDIVRRAVSDQPLRQTNAPFRWSEDFGRFTSICTSTLFGIGSGEGVPALHNPDYDFPDDLVPIGAEVLERIVRECLG